MPKNDKKNEEIDFSAALANAGSGTTLQIKRLQPTWCDGILCEEEIDPHDPVDLEQIREQWGGRKLTLTLRQHGIYRTSTTLKFPDEPKKNSVELINPEIAARALPPPPPPAPPAPPPDDSGNKLLEIVLGMQNQQAIALAEIQKTAADTIAKAQEISAATQKQTLEGQVDELKKQIQEMGQGGGPQGDKKSALDGIKEMAATMKEIEEIRGSFGGGGGGEESSFLSEGIKQFMGLEMEKKKFEMQMMMKKMELSQQGQGGGTAPPLEERPKIEAGQPAESAPANLPAAAAPMLSAFAAMDIKQQAGLVAAHIEQLGEDKRIEFLEQLSASASDFIEREEEEEEEEEETEEEEKDASPPPQTTAG